ncbi:MAG: hypothetical protein R6V27_02835 [Balneolaceae bacterium]
MNLFHFDVETLERWLTWELSGSVLFFLSFFRILALLLLAPLILLFLPVLIGTLWIERRYGWLLFLALFVVVPAVAIYFIIDSGQWFFALQFVPIGLFLFYCFLLKLTIPMWERTAEPDAVQNLRI